MWASQRFWEPVKCRLRNYCSQICMSPQLVDLISLHFIMTKLLWVASLRQTSEGRCVPVCKKEDTAGGGPFVWYCSDSLKQSFGSVHALGGVLEKKKIGTQTPDQVMGLTIVPWQERILKAMRDSSL